MRNWYLAGAERLQDTNFAHSPSPASGGACLLPGWFVALAGRGRVEDLSTAGR